MKSKGFSHYILTRFNNGIYGREGASKWMYDRMKLFASTRDSVLSQAGEFEWVISIDPLTTVRHRNAIGRSPRVTLTEKDIREVFTSGEIIPEESWVITTRLDNDDLYRPGAVLAIQSLFSEQIQIIDIEYEQYDLATGKYYTSNRRTPNSPFLSLVEPSSCVRTAYCRPHNLLADGYPTADGGKMSIPARRVEGVKAYMVIHSSNMTNKIVGTEVKK